MSWLTDYFADQPLIAPARTRMVFQQSFAPTGWTKDLSSHDKALRITSEEASGGGSIYFSTIFNNNRKPVGTVQYTTLDLSQIAQHNHRFTFMEGYHVGPANFPGAGTNISDSIIVEPSSWDGGGSGHTHSLNMQNLLFDVAYVDVIIAGKD